MFVLNIHIGVYNKERIQQARFINGNYPIFHFVPYYSRILCYIIMFEITAPLKCCFLILFKKILST